MELRKEDYPVALQAYEVRESKEDFIAEQVVNSPAEAEGFMSKYAGKLIKTREVKPAESKRIETHTPRKASVPAWVLLLVVVVLLVIIGFATGWIPALMKQSK